MPTRLEVGEPLVPGDGRVDVVDLQGDVGPLGPLGRKAWRDDRTRSASLRPQACQMPPIMPSRLGRARTSTCPQPAWTAIKARQPPNRYLARTDDGARFSDEALDRLTGLQLDRADGQRRGDLGHELPKRPFHLVNLHRRSPRRRPRHGPGPAWAAGSRPWRKGGTRLRAAGADEGAPREVELPVERHAGQVRPDHRQPARFGRRGPRSRPAAAVGGQRAVAASQRRAAGLTPRRSDETDAKSAPSARKPAGTATAAMSSRFTKLV